MVSGTRGGERDRDERKDLTKDGLDLFLRNLGLALVKHPYARPCEPVLLQLGVERIVGGGWPKHGPADGDAAADGVRVRGADVGFRGEEESFLAVVLVRDDGCALHSCVQTQRGGAVGQRGHVSQPSGGRSRKGDQRVTLWTHRVLTLRATTTLDAPSERVTVSDDGAIDTGRADAGGRRSVARRWPYGLQPGLQLSTHCLDCADWKVRAREKSQIRSSGHIRHDDNTPSSSRTWSGSKLITFWIVLSERIPPICLYRRPKMGA